VAYNGFSEVVAPDCLLLGMWAVYRVDSVNFDLFACRLCKQITVSLRLPFLSRSGGVCKLRNLNGVNIAGALGWSLMDNDKFGDYDPR